MCLSTYQFWLRYGPILTFTWYTDTHTIWQIYILPFRKLQTLLLLLFQICAWNFHSSHCNASYSDMSTAGSESFLDSLWTREQTEQILNKLNTLPPDKLKSTLKISQNLSENIAASRPFTSIGQVVAI